MRCEGRKKVWRPFGAARCERHAAVVVNGRGYCREHDPRDTGEEREAAQRRERQREKRAEQVRRSRQDSSRRAVKCRTCGGRKQSKLCATCNDRGITWSEGVPFTACPANADGGDLACGRSGLRCPCCFRRSDEIGGPEDVAHDLAVRGLDKQGKR